MKAILRSYFYRLFHEKAFYVELGILFGVCLIVSAIVRAIASANDMTIHINEIALVAINGGVAMGTSSIPWINVLFFVIFGAVRYKKEVDSGAMRNYIISGYSRKQVYNSLYIGNMFFFLCLTLAIASGILLPFIGAPSNLAAGNTGSFLGALGLSFLLEFALATFAYFTFVLLKGHAFGTTMSILVYLGLAMLSSIVIIVLSLNIAQIGEPLTIVLLSILGVLPPSLNGAFSRGLLKSAPGGGLYPISIDTEHAEETLRIINAINNRDWTALNVTAALVLSAILIFGSYFLGLWINNRRDLK